MLFVAKHESGALLRRARESQHPKVYQRDVAKLLGIKEESYRAYEYGRVRLPVDIAKRLAAEWGIGWQSFYGQKPISLSGEPMGKIKVVGVASAGKGVETLSDEDIVTVPLDMVREDYSGLKLDGDSMMPMLYPGDIAIFRDYPSERVGLIFAVRRHNEGDIVIKRLIFEQDGWRLKSENPQYETCPLMPGDQLLGYLVGILRWEGNRRMTLFDHTGLRDGWN